MRKAEAARPMSSAASGAVGRGASDIRALGVIFCDSARGTAGLAAGLDGTVYGWDFRFFPHPFPTLPLSVQTLPFCFLLFPFISFYFPESGLIKGLRED